MVVVPLWYFADDGFKVADIFRDANDDYFVAVNFYVWRKKCVYVLQPRNARVFLLHLRYGHRIIQSGSVPSLFTRQRDLKSLARP